MDGGALGAPAPPARQAGQLWPAQGGAAAGSSQDEAGGSSKVAQALFEAVPVKDRVSVAYINRATTPRITRQVCCLPELAVAVPCGPAVVQAHARTQ